MATQAELDALNRALASGTLRIKYKDLDKTFRSQQEMLAYRRLIEVELGQRPRRVAKLAHPSKGLE